MTKKLSEEMESDLEYIENTKMSSIPKNDFRLYINQVKELENEIENLNVKNEMLNGCNKKYFLENKELKEKLNNYISMACESKRSCNCACHNCEIDEDSQMLNNSGVSG